MSSAIQLTETEPVQVLVFVCPGMLGKVRSVLGGIQSLEANDLHQALRGLANRPQLLITKADSTGFELFRTARDYYPQTKVVMLCEETDGKPDSFGN